MFMAMSLALFVASCGTSNTTEQLSNATPAANGASTVDHVMMPQNTAIAVTLVDSIDTDVQVSGTEFRAKLSEPIVVGGHTLFANHAEAKGSLDKIVESGRLKTPAELNFSLTAIKDANGRWVDVGTNMIIEKNASHTDREVAMIGGGAIVGGIIGKIIDRKGSTEIGVATGAAAGTGLAVVTGKQDIFYGAGTEITFFSSRDMQVALK
jgi:hypothetical protein